MSIASQPASATESGRSLTARLLNPSMLTSFALVLLTIVFFGAIRYRLRAMPLERDEGEYAYAGQLMLQGIPPYKLAYNMKLPGIYAAYAAILAIFGETPSGIHLGLLLVNVATILLLYLLATRLFGRLAGVLTALSYALLSTSYSVMGFQAHATNFVVLPALAAIVVLLRALECPRGWLFALSGLLSGIAVLMKQHGAFFALFCFFYLVARQWKTSPRRELVRRSALFAAGVLLPYVLTCVVMYATGVFHEFWFWTVSYAGEYSKMGLRRGIEAFDDSFTTITEPAIPMWILAAIGLTALVWGRIARKHSGFLVSLFAFSFLALCPGVYFREHYFILLLPVISMLIAVAIASAVERLASLRKPYLLAIPIAVYFACFAAAIVHQHDFYFRLNADEALNSTYDESPFLPAVKVGDYVRDHSALTARIAVLGSEPEIYFYARRRSATGYLYMYSLIEHQKYDARMQQQMMHELESNQPEYLINVDYWDSWGEREDAPNAAAFLAWLEQFMQTNYERVGIADGPDDTTYVWGDAARAYHPKAQKVIYILRHKN